MNKIIMSMGAIAIACCVGCKSVVTVDDTSKLGVASGITAAYVLNNQVSVDTATRESIINVMTEVVKYIPQTNETFYAVWTPIVNKFVDNAIANGKLTEKQGERVKKDFGYVVTLLDKYVEKKGIKQYQELIDAFVHSFVDSFLKYFKPTVGFSMNAVVIDEEAYEILMTEIFK